MLKRLLVGLLALVLASPVPAAAFGLGHLGSRGGFGAMGGGSPKPATIVSASIRSGAPYSIGASGALNVTSARIYDFPVGAVVNPQVEYANIWVNSAREGAAQEQCAGTQTILKLSLLTGVNATQANTGAGYNQSGATLTSLSWSQLAADVPGYLMKLDETVNPPTFTAKTFAQFQSDGGALASNTLTVPSCYYVRTDPAAAISIPAKTAYAIQQEEDRPAQQTASVASMTGTTVSITVPTTARYRTNDKLALASFTPTTYNTPASAPVPITVTSGTTLTLELRQSVSVSIASPAVVTDPTNGSAANDELTLTWTGTPPTGLTSGGTYYVKTVLDTNSYTVSATPGGAVINTSGSQSGIVFRRKSNLGTVTVLGNMQAQKVLNARAQSTVASNGFGDIQTTAATTAAVSNTSTNWSSVSTSGTPDGTNMIYVARVTGTSPSGKKSIAIFGDSIACCTNDANQANPSGAFLKGDQYGGLGAIRRAATIGNYPFFMVAIPGTLPATENSYGGGLMRQWVARGASGIINEHVHNEVFVVSTLGQLQTSLRTYNTAIRAAVPTSTKLIAVTPTPTTAQVSASQWNARNAGAQLQSGPFIFPTGIAYTYRDYLMGALNPAIGDPDGYIDLAQYVSNALTGATVAVDGYWPTDGTAFWGTGDGTHPTLNTHGPIVANPIAADLSLKMGF